MYLEDLAAAARAVAAGVVTSRALVEAALRRADEVEATLHAFAFLDRARALALADAADAGPLPRVGVPTPGREGALRGVPIGVKDIVDVAGVPCERGSSLFAGRVPKESASLARNLEAAGAVILGKTVTAELAFYHPGPTTNPHDLTRTPGGSSMGSAAAVAAGIVPGAVGTQTNGSVIRPAAFCGVVGFKPTHGRVPLDGVMPFAPTLDHGGAIARTVESAARLVAAMCGDRAEEWWSGAPSETPRLAAVLTKEWEHADAPMRARFQADVDRLASAGRPIEWPSLPEGLDDAVPVLRAIMAFEFARGTGREIERAPDRVSEVARSLYAEGRTLSRDAYADAIRTRERLVTSFDRWAARYDAILTPPALGEAPDRATTGDPRFCSRWTLVGAPAITIPTGRGPHGLPLGLQLVGATADDRRVVAAAAWAEAHLR